MPSRRFSIFPLPGVVLFPGMLMPLRIYEPRYRELLNKALKSDRRITIVLVRPNDLGKVNGDAGVFRTASEGEIVHCEQLSDGNYRVILEGRSRTRLLRECPKEGLVRVFEGEEQRDILADKDRQNLEKIVQVLQKRVKTWIEKRLPESVHASVLQRLDEASTIGNRLDRMSALVIHVVSHRQALLETLSVFHRACMLENLTRWAGTCGPFGHTTMN